MVGVLTWKISSLFSAGPEYCEVMQTRAVVRGVRSLTKGSLAARQDIKPSGAREGFQRHHLFFSETMFQEVVPNQYSQDQQNVTRNYVFENSALYKCSHLYSCGFCIFPTQTRLIRRSRIVFFNVPEPLNSGETFLGRVSSKPSVSIFRQCASELEYIRHENKAASLGRTIIHGLSFPADACDASSFLWKELQ